jgi:hypothetical protein
MKKLLFYCILIVVAIFSCENPQPISDLKKKSLNVTLLKDILKNNDDANLFITSIIQDREFALSMKETEIKDRVQKINVLIEKNNSGKFGIDSERLLEEVTKGLSKNTLTAMVSTLNYLSNYKYSREDLEESFEQLINEAYNEKNENLRINWIPSCEFRCAAAALGVGSPESHGARMYYSGCVYACYMF